jgi:transcriptional regulator with XRE-family HTH domain
MDQSTISDLENPNYEYAPQIGTLERLANAFDVPLIVRFGSWEELWDWENNLTPERLAPKTFNEVLPKLEALVAKSEASAVRKIRRHPYGLIDGNDNGTPGRPLDQLLGKQTRNQFLGHEDSKEAETRQIEGLFAAVGGRQR